ncbi:rodlin [Streptomyces sp. DT24]|uniref:rodlin n=1 Tax=unclassified Streptomyces TaxID=2593676 RepID=UPI0023B9C0D8|nr:rodlin [Streptomyces sp. AM 4-1-1]WEH36530.1 rodlin [Streptomyces sp. AM 4-1-1]
MKKMMAGAAVAASLVGLSAALAPTAMAIGNDTGTTSFNGNGATQAYGNAATQGDGSPQSQLIQGTLNDLCLGVPVKANLGSLIGVVPITVQDVNVLASPQNQQCADNSTQAKGDEALSHLVDGIPVLSGNGVANR